MSLERESAGGMEVDDMRIPCPNCDSYRYPDEAECVVCAGDDLDPEPCPHGSYQAAACGRCDADAAADAEYERARDRLDDDDHDHAYERAVGK